MKMSPTQLLPYTGGLSHMVITNVYSDGDTGQNIIIIRRGAWIVSQGKRYSECTSGHHLHSSSGRRNANKRKALRQKSQHCL